MSNAQQSSDEAKLKKLGQQVRKGWAKLHPLKPQEMSAVREALLRQREQAKAKEQQKLASSPTKTPSVEKAQSQKSKTQEQQRKAQSKDYGHEH